MKIKGLSSTPSAGNEEKRGIMVSLFSSTENLNFLVFSFIFKEGGLLKRVTKANKNAEFTQKMIKKTVFRDKNCPCYKTYKVAPK